MKPEEYIADLFDSDDHIALVLVPRDQDAKTQQRIWAAGKAASEKVQRWLRHENARGSDIYVSMNPLRAGALRRSKKDIASVRRLYLDLDKEGSVKLNHLLRDSTGGRIPSPSYIINTSKDRFQVIWNVKPGAFTSQEAEGLMRGLADEYGGDRAATDVTRVLRLPGFKHRGRSTWITMSATRQKVTEKKDWPPRLFREPKREPATATRKSASKRGSLPAGGDKSPSGQDWARTRDGLRRGENPGAIEHEIEKKRQDKHNPADYARRTVQRAAASLALER